jgi:hypothetical protein
MGRKVCWEKASGVSRWSFVRAVSETTSVHFPRDSQSADLFIEAPDGLYVPLPKRLPNAAARAEADANDGLVRFEVDLARGGNARELKGKTLTLTLVSDAGATEATWTVP